MKTGLKKKTFKTLEQKSFQCDLPETQTPTKPQGFQTPKSVSTSQGHYGRSPEINEVSKAQAENKRVLTGREGVHNGIRTKNPQNLRSSPQLGGLLRYDG